MRRCSFKYIFLPCKNFHAATIRVSQAFLLHFAQAGNWRLWANLMLLLLLVGEVDLAVKTGHKALQAFLPPLVYDKEPAAIIDSALKNRNTDCEAIGRLNLNIITTLTSLRCSIISRSGGSINACAACVRTR